MEKLPPQNIEAEQSLLGSLMLDPEAIYKVSDFLLPRDFYKKAHQNIYDAMLTLTEKRESLDILSVSAKLKEKNILKEVGGKSYLTSLVNSVPTSSHVKEYANIVCKKRILRDLIGYGQEISVSGYDEDKDVDILIDEAERKIFSIAQGTSKKSFTALKDNLESAFHRLEHLSTEEGQMRGIPTGFTDLDSILSGLQKSDLIILAARPSMGKSALASNIAKNVAMKNNTPVGLFSLEMSVDQIVDRLIADISGINLWKLRTGNLKKKGENNDFARIRDSFEELSKLPIYIDESISFNIMQMRAMARRLQAEKGLGLIVVDYLQLMQPRSERASMVEQMTEISRELKKLAKELDVPVLALSQLSRAVEQRTPQVPRLSDLRESGCLTGDTLIENAQTGKRIPIKDLVGKENIPVHCINKKWQTEVKNISKVFASGQKMTYELKTRSGFRIKASSNHPFLKVDGWKRLDQLRVGDRIATPQKINIQKPKNNISNDELILIAHLLGDGCILPRQPYHYTSADIENIEIVEKSAKKLFHIKGKIVKQENWFHIYLTSPYRLTKGKYHPITKWFETLNIDRVRSWEKQIPENIFHLNNKKIALFLKHLWATDGHISIKKCKTGKRSVSANIYYATTSIKMAEGIKYLLLKFGIRTKISIIQNKKYRNCYHVTINGAHHQLSFLKDVGCFGKRSKNIPYLIKKLSEVKQNTNVDGWPKEAWQVIINPSREKYGISWRKFCEEINTSYCGSTLFKSGISTIRLKKIVQFIDSQEIEDAVKSDVFWDEIISIEKLKVEEVYDATVPGLHNFLANGIFVHNSIEQDADVVLFIYREDYYRQDTNRKHIADIIIAKHRNGPTGKVELYFDQETATFKNLDKSH